LYFGFVLASTLKSDYNEFWESCTKGVLSLKHFFALLTVCALLIGCTGCAPAQIVLDELIGKEAVAAVETIPHFGFSNGEVTETTHIVTEDELMNLPLHFSSCRSSVFFDSLTGSDRLIYRAYEYALENSFTNILIDASLVEDSDRLYDLLMYLSLDSPLLEQNICYEMGTFTIYYPVEIYEWYSKNACFEGYYVTVKNFAQDLWSKKTEAFQKAEAILLSLSLTDDMSDMQKAEAIYRYVGEHVIYEDYEDTDELTVHPYLHDALFKGKTHCDGYANALSLLLNMAGLPCVEKQYVSLDSSETGHTWDYVCLDSGWTNIDGTFTEWIPDVDCGLSAGPGFAFSDEFQQQTPDFADCYEPSSGQIGLTPDAHLSSISDEAFPSAAIDAYVSHNYEWAYILVDAFSEDDVSRQMQEIANRLRTRIHYASFELVEDRTAIFIYNDNLYEDD